MNDRAVVAAPTLVRYGVLAWVCTLSMITYIDRVCIKQVRGDIQTELGLTPDQFAWAFSAFALSYSLLEVPSGWFGDRIGPRKVLARIVLCWSLFTSLTGAAWNLVSLVTIRFLFGAGEAGAYPNIARALRNWFPYRHRGQAQGLLWAFGRWGGAVAPLLIGSLSGVFGWRGAFVVLGLVGIVWMIGFYFWFRDTPAEHPSVNDAERALIAEPASKISSRMAPALNPQPPSEIDEGRSSQAPGHQESSGDMARPAPLSWSSLLRSPTLWFLCGMYFCSNAGWCFFITWDVAYFVKTRGMTGLPLMLASGGPLFFGGIACLLGGFLTDRQVRIWGPRWGRTLQGLVSYSLGGTFFLLSLLAGDDFLAVGALCLASFGKDFAMAVSWSTCLDIGHRYSGTVAGFMNMVGNLGTVVSPPLVAWLARTTGTAKESNWSAALYYSAGMFFVASFCWAFINPRRVIVYSAEDQQRLRAEGALE